MKKYVIVVAGGKGLRMGGEIPKQFIPVKGKPVLMRTLETFHACDPNIELIVVLPVEQRSYWEHLCAEYSFTLPHRIAAGGETRFHSVKNGLALVEEDGVVGVHDEVLRKNAACLLTISDSFVSPEITTAEQRQKSFTDMMKVALGAEMAGCCHYPLLRGYA